MAKRRSPAIPFTIVIVMGTFLAIGGPIFWIGFYGTQERCVSQGRFCPEICDESLFAESVELEERQRACEIAAETFAKRDEYAQAVVYLERCRDIGCDDVEPSIKAMKCLAEPGGCEVLCTAADLASCMALLEHLSKSEYDSEALDHGIGLVNRVCDATPSACHQAASLFCNASDGFGAALHCASACDDGGRPEICYSAGLRHNSYASSYQFSEPMKYEEELEEANALKARGCAADPTLGSDCAQLACTLHPKECGVICQEKRNAAYCYALGEVFAVGNERLPKNESKSVAYKERACELDANVSLECPALVCGKDPASCEQRCNESREPKTCYAAGELLMRGYEGRDPDEVLGSRLKRQACTQDPNAGIDCARVLNEPDLP